ncbi:MAG: triphosphoribosyl-dephospho-CoA synthase, partial [Acidilobaceae archaeon]
MRGGGCSLIPIVSLGLYVEPVIHPKPGAVTALEAHADKDVYDFLSNASLVEYSLLESCREGSMGAGLRAYRMMVSKLGLKKNIALGSLMLLVPVASVLRDLAGASVRELLEGAHRLVLEKTGREEALEYYALLEYFSPSHLGKYYGQVPGVGSGSPDSLLEVLRAASWDMVHGELLNGYPITMEALNLIRESPGSLREKALKT